MLNPARTEPNALADVQARADSRNLDINQVGVRELRHPLRVRDKSGEQSTVARVQMSVGLPAASRGAHMSRFVEILNQYREPISTASLPQLLAQMREHLGGVGARVEFCFAYFINKTAPVSARESLMDYEVTLRGEMRADLSVTSQIKAVIPVASLCPCSKAVADYGAHNQRAHVTLEASPADNARPLLIEDLIAHAESEASAELFALLKRDDEKLITERAYDNPKFAEDLTRDIAQRLNQDPRIGAYRVQVENFESIHNHSAFAEITRAV